MRTSLRPSRSPGARLLAGAMSMGLLLVACGGSGSGAGASTAAAGAAPLRVAASTTILADIVRSVGGDRVAVQSIVPAGVGPEDYEPRTDDAKRLADAQLIVSNGVGLDDFLDRLLTATGASGAPRLVLGDGIPTLAVDGEPNPHFWLDPTIVRDDYLPKIVDALATVSPADRATFAANAAAYATQLTALDGELAAEVATIPDADRKLVTFHDAFPYLARHYGFDLIGVVTPNAGQEPTAGEMRALVDAARAADVKAVFAEAQTNPGLSEALVGDAGVDRVVTSLYDDALGPAPADTYPGLLRWDIGQLVAALR